MNPDRLRTTPASPEPRSAAAGRLTAVAVVHRIRPKSWEQPLSTAIDKRPVEGRIPLQSLGLAVEVLNEEEEEVTFNEDLDGADMRSLDINISGFERGEIE